MRLRFFLARHFGHHAIDGTGDKARPRCKGADLDPRHVFEHAREIAGRAVTHVVAGRLASEGAVERVMEIVAPGGVETEAAGAKVKKDGRGSR